MEHVVSTAMAKSSQNLPKSTPVKVVGAGITGLSAALLLARKKYKVELLESESTPGGLLAPVTFEGVAYDRGSHRVHPEAHPLLVELTREANWQEQRRAGTLILKGKRLSYPLDPLRFVAGLGLKTTSEMALGWLTRPGAFQRTMSWEHDRREVEHDEGFESFVMKRVGEAAYQQFYEPYARKVWGIEPGELSQTVAKQRVSTSNPLSSILRPTVKHFLYPKLGMASLISLLRQKLSDLGGTVRLGESLDLKKQHSEPIIYTGHLDALAPDFKLTHRGLYLVYMALPRDVLDDTDTWYVPESDYWFGRVSQPEKFSNELSNRRESMLCIEIPEGCWGPNEDFTKHARTLVEQLHAANILNYKVDPTMVYQKFLPRIYPMYTRGWASRQQNALVAAARHQPIFPCGRQGLYLHCNMDQAVATAAAAVEHMSRGGSAEAWVPRCQEFADFRVRD